MGKNNRKPVQISTYVMIKSCAGQADPATGINSETVRMVVEDSPQYFFAVETPFYGIFGVKMDAARLMSRVNSLGRFARSILFFVPGSLKKRPLTRASFLSTVEKR